MVSANYRHFVLGLINIQSQGQSWKGERTWEEEVFALTPQTSIVEKGA